MLIKLKQTRDFETDIFGNSIHIYPQQESIAILIKKETKILCYSGFVYIVYIDGHLTWGGKSSFNNEFEEVK